MPTHNDVLFWDREYAHVNWADGIDLSWIRPEIPEGSLVLDAGCGNGRYLKELCRHFSCVGMDISSEGIRRAADRISAGKETGQARPELLTGSVTCIPLRTTPSMPSFPAAFFSILASPTEKKHRRKSVASSQAAVSFSLNRSGRTTCAAAGPHFRTVKAGPRKTHTSEIQASSITILRKRRSENSSRMPDSRS
ncbi:MAG: class I SAM-dependent methyltransferase [Methanosarcinaceae archaeon]|nr:class I SAM-dependent methyltransferase [Methanosarcinaceae archaeon]